MIDVWINYIAFFVLGLAVADALHTWDIFQKDNNDDSTHET